MCVQSSGNSNVIMESLPELPFAHCATYLTIFEIKQLSSTSKANRCEKFKSEKKCRRCRDPHGIHLKNNPFQRSFLNPFRYPPLTLL